MKITMMLTGDAMQFNLKPETEHEKEFVKMIVANPGQATIHKGVDIGLCQGGYLRNFSYGESERQLAITITNETKKTDSADTVQVTVPADGAREFDAQSEGAQAVGEVGQDKGV